MRKSTTESIKIQLVGVEDSIDYEIENIIKYDYQSQDLYSLKYRRHYYLKRLLELQLKEFIR